MALDTKQINNALRIKKNIIIDEKSCFISGFS